ncbi:hypothetical protein Tamer19_16250 [Cupriavidus sp. TA19]|uniref:hypothetical protein n=1 Tax=unclassified Cupriavidus TaxID=2640874 RepID=UPI000E2E856F|nr:MULTISPECIES: hypothetical protein [unclassified Cupriavidus]BDB24322.1 hypothetical protein CTP10_R16730 [Cupriavidus sp. P-10]GLC92217.1 hypothetical protein Tamer19_16250 [Cupriavidus sp. TA19]
MTAMQDPRLGACAYLLHLLLQRAEASQPGFLDDLIRGVAADRAGMPDVPEREQALPVFDEALRMLEFANVQMKEAQALGRP